MPRSKEHNQQIKDERREQILSAALQLFATKGFAATKISDISSVTGISQGLIYHYYKSKDEVFTQLVESAVEKMNTAAMNLEKLQVSAKEKIIIATDGLLKGLDGNPDTVNYYFLLTQAAISDSFPENARQIILEKNQVKYEIMDRIFTQGQKDGTVKNFGTNEMTVLFFSTINGLALNKAVNKENFTMPDKEIIISMFLKNN